MGSKKRVTGKKEKILRDAVSHVQSKNVDTVFVATEAQVAFLRAIAEYDSQKRITVNAICKRAGVGRAAYYRWREQPGFGEWLNSNRDRLFQAEMVFVDRVLLNKAKAGELSSIRVAYEKRGELHKRMDIDFQRRVPVENDMLKVMELFNVVKRMLEG